MDFSELMARISTDEKRRCTVEAFRQELKDLPPLLRPHTMERLPRICPGKVIRRRRDGSLQTAYTGVVLLELDNLDRPEDKRQMKELATSWPTTFAVVEGANGNSLGILVRGTYEDGTLPSGDSEQSERFHQELYKRCATVYASVLGRSPKAKEAHIDDTFIWPYDPSPYLDNGAAAVKVSRSLINTGLDTRQEDALEYGPQSSRPSVDNNSLWRRRFALAVSAAKEKSLGEEKTEPELEAVALEALRLDIPQEDTVKQASWSVRWRDIEREKQRAIIESVYLEHGDQQGRNRSHSMQEMTYQLQTFLQCRYDLRFNVLTNGVEWRRNDAASFVFQPLDSRVMNTMIQECHESGLDIFDRDMKRYLGSTRIRDYNVAHAYLNELDLTWDGTTDYIGAWADRVPCRNPQWREWFHTWFLAMVAQWTGRNPRYGNAIVPLLVSAQGMHKSTFCRNLLPQELRSWGYTDNLSLGEERPVHLAMSQMLLINLDEFNRISPAKQQGFLKNILQLPSVKVKRLYAKHIEEVPRLASFIATTNMADVLTDPSGSRRFIGVQVTGSIDVSTMPNHTQLFAQAQAELDDGARYWFDDAETTRIMQHNHSFQQIPSALHFFLEHFEPGTADNGSWMTAAALLEELKSRAGSVFQAPAVNTFGRMLNGCEGLQHKHTKYGEAYWISDRIQG